MEVVHKVENALEQPFSSLPPLPQDARKGLAGIWPWLALIGGILQLVAAWSLYNWARTADEWVDAVNQWSVALGGERVSSGLTLWVWLAIATLAISGILLLIAFPKLQKREKAGWDLLLLGAIVNLVYGIVSLFIDGSRGGAGALIWTLLMSALGIYLLFQVREFFGGKTLKAKN